MWIAISIVGAILAAVLILYISSGYNFKFIDSYKKNFVQNFENIKSYFATQNTDTPVQQPETNTDTDNEKEIQSSDVVTINYTDLTKKFVQITEPMALNAASTARFEPYSGGVLCVIENSVVLYNKSGEVEWSIPIQLSSPVLKVKGPYILLFEQHGKKVSLYEGDKQLFQVETSEKILTGNISANGDCALITEKTHYKGAVLVYNKSGQEIFSRSFGKNSALAVAISDSRRLCVSLLSNENKVTSQIVFLNVDKTEEDATLNYDDSVIFDLDFVGNTLYAFADNALISITNNGKQNWKYEYSDKTLHKYSDNSSNSRLMLFDASNSAELCIVTNSGKEKQ